MMQFHKLDSRRLRVTDLPSTVEGLRVDATELEVIVSYVGDPSGRKAIVLDNVVVPLMMAAPELFDCLVEVKHTLIELYEQVYKDDESDNDVTALIDRVIAVIAQATNEEVNA